MKQTSFQSPNAVIAFLDNHEVFSIDLVAGDNINQNENNKFSQFTGKLTKEETKQILELLSSFEK